MVCGLGEVGYRVAELLLDLGEQVTVVTLAGREEWVDIVRKQGANVHIGDARNADFLIRCGLADVDSVIACTHNDGTNVEVMLDVRRSFPEKRTIARIVDPSMAHHAEKHLGVHRAIAMTAAAAPIFAAATYGDSILTALNVGSDRFLALRVTGPQKLDEPPLLVISSEGDCVTTQSTELKRGESAVVMSHADTMHDKAPKHQRRHSLLRALSPVAMSRFVREVWINTTVQLRAVWTVILFVFVASVVVFQFGLKLSLVDSLYFVVTTATTTGYGDITPKDSVGWIKLYTCFMMIISAAGLAILFSMVTDYVLSARMVQFRGHHHVPEFGHVIVVGAGAAGFRTVEELIRLEAPVVAIDRAEDGEYVGSIRSKTHVVIGDAREPDTLVRAGIKHAKSIVILTPSDTVNLGIGLTAKELNPEVRVVLSIMDADFADKVSSIAEIDAALSSPVLAAPTFVGAALFETAVASFRLGARFCTLCKDPSGQVSLGGVRMSLDVRMLPGKAPNEL